MARPKEFDPDQALEAAMRRFWERGFEATSLQDLTDCTGVQKTSLYATYGDKRELFLKALAHYQDASLERTRARLEAEGSPREAIEGFMNDVAKLATSESGCKRGCMFVNAAIELAPHDAKVEELCRRHSQAIERLIEGTLERAVAARELRKGFDCAATARFLVATIFGLNVAAKAAAGPKRLRDVVTVALSVLER